MIRSKLLLIQNLKHIPYVLADLVVVVGLKFVVAVELFVAAPVLKVPPSKVQHHALQELEVLLEDLSYC